MKNQLYWLTNSTLDAIQLYDPSYKKQAFRATLFQQFKNLFPSNQNINFQEQKGTTLLQPIGNNQYQILEKGAFPYLIRLFQSFLLEEKFALEIQQQSKQSIAFEPVAIFKGKQLLEQKRYFKLKVAPRIIEYEDCIDTCPEQDEILLVAGYYLYFSNSLKEKLQPFVKKHYPKLNFVPGLPYLIC